MNTISCEVCGKNPATSLSAFCEGNPSGVWVWMNVCRCSVETEDYYVPLTGKDGILDGPGIKLLGWLRHLNGKPWFNQRLFLEAARRAKA